MGKEIRFGNENIKAYICGWYLGQKQKMKVEDFLRKHKSTLNIAGIEKKLNMPMRTIPQVWNMNRDLPEVHRKKVLRYVRSLGTQATGVK